MWSKQHTAQLTEYRTAVTTAYKMSTRSVWLLLRRHGQLACGRLV